MKSGGIVTPVVAIGCYSVATCDIIPPPNAKSDDMHPVGRQRDEPAGRLVDQLPHQILIK
jgi:hypothetical protein